MLGKLSGRRIEMRLRRYNTEGNDVTGSPDVWHISDCEILVTPFGDPEQTEGQHTNGPANIFIRKPEVGGYASEWARCDEKSLHKVMKAWVTFGISAFWSK
jgi:hypothetical protein